MATHQFKRFSVKHGMLLLNREASRWVKTKKIGRGGRKEQTGAKPTDRQGEKTDGMRKNQNIMLNAKQNSGDSYLAISLCLVVPLESYKTLTCFLFGGLSCS